MIPAPTPLHSHALRVPAFVARPLRRERRLVRAVRACGVLEKRYQTFLPGIQYRLGHSPGFFGFVGPDKEGVVALEQVKEEAFVGREEILGSEVGAQLYLLEVEGVVGTVDVQVQGYLV